MTFSSAFDSGNLALVEETTPYEQLAMVVPLQPTSIRKRFELHLAGDPVSTVGVIDPIETGDESTYR